MPLIVGGQKRSGVFDTVWPSATMPTRQWCRIAPRKARADRTRHRLEMPQQPNLYLEPKWLRCLATARKTIADSTRRSSQAVPHPSTNRALCRLTSEVGRDPVHSTRYGRQRHPCGAWARTAWQSDAPPRPRPGQARQPKSLAPRRLRQYQRARAAGRAGNAAGELGWAEWICVCIEICIYT